MGLRVYGVVMQDSNGTPKAPDGLTLLPMRELAAVIEEGDFGGRDEVDATTITRHDEVVTAMFVQDAILPTPVGTAFRSSDALQRWMELHYVSLSDALAWVEGRQAARVHVGRAQARNGEKDGSDLAAIAAEVSRSLRRHAVATVPLRNEAATGIVLTAAYLVERELWTEFADAVDDEGNKHTLVSVELTGPWPPYDFVRMQFRG